MNRTLHTVLAMLLLLFLALSCTRPPDSSWREAIPGKTPFVLMPAENATLQSFLQAPYMPFLDDITSAAIPMLTEVSEATGGELRLRSILLYPATGNQLHPVWISSAPPGVSDTFQEQFYREFTQNEYRFRGITVHRLHIGERILFAAVHRGNLMLSESSLALEDLLRGYLGELPTIDLNSLEAGPGSFIMNTPSLDHWIERVASVIHRPSITGAFRGSGPVVFRLDTTADASNLNLSMSGEMELQGDEQQDGGGASPLVAALSTENRPLQLDRYISSDAAAFGIFRHPPRTSASDSISDPTSLDSLLIHNNQRYRELSDALGAEFAAVMYAESGFESVGEHLFLRRVSDIAAFRQALEQLENEGHLQRSEGTWLASGNSLGRLIGSDLCTFEDYYITLTGEAVVIAKRKGLAEIVASDRNRRRVIYYEENYGGIRDRLPQQVSGFFVAGEEFYPYVRSFLAPEHPVELITNQFDLFSLSVNLDENGESMEVRLGTYDTRERTSPYEENWIKPGITAGLSGKPVLGDLGGSPREEIVIATETGNIYALAASDGTEVLQINTGGDVPVGSPVVYDWYGTGQNVILQAAGNKIYGWNDTGSPLPQFPLELEEEITTPLTIHDVDRNGLPEAIVGTSDRRLHALDGRGNNISGWPVSTNSTVGSKPLATQLGGELALVAFSENAIHAWNSDGTPKEGYPKFINASLTGSPVRYEEHILGAAADGHLYAVGPRPLFHDSLNVYTDFMSDPESPAAVYVSNSSLSGTPSVHSLSVQTSDSTYREPMILTSGSNGSVFLFSLEGQLRFTASMGQPLSAATSPFVADVNSDGLQEIVALADFGRLYAWDTLGGSRVELPTAGMEYPLIDNLDGDDYVEMVAQTGEGLRCWTLYGE